MDTDTSSEAESEEQRRRRDMLQYVAVSSATIQSQQRGEPELTFDEKIAVLQDVLSRRPGDFLMRFGLYLRADHLMCFQSLRQDYEVDFRVREVELLLNRDKNRKKVRNRRFEYLQQEMERGDYFNDREMRRRNPLLYERYIGQYLSDEDRKELNLEVSSEVGLSAQLMDQLDRLRTAELLARQQDAEEMQEEEEEEDSEDETEDETEVKRPDDDTDCRTDSVRIQHEADATSRTEISTKEKRLLRDEFVSIMHQSFLAGSDKDFNYQQVDTCCEYDPLKIRERDEEEAYFDDEEPETWSTEDTQQYIRDEVTECRDQ